MQEFSRETPWTPFSLLSLLTTHFGGPFLGGSRNLASQLHLGGQQETLQWPWQTWIMLTTSA